jgi:hypothetical protein
MKVGALHCAGKSLLTLAKICHLDLTKDDIEIYPYVKKSAFCV